MYRLEWIEQIKLRGRNAVLPAPLRVSPVVLSLGFTSLLTDISAEMVNSVLPAYLVLHLRLSPLQYGLIDGIYNGFAIALLSLAAGYLADRAARHKEAALVGYGLSAICKALLLGIGASWTGLLWIIGVDRAGKGIRMAPRDALISLHTPERYFANSFAVHRAMDACGSLIGPILAFALLAALPSAFDAVWATSLVFALLGVAALWLFVPASTGASAAPTAARAPSISGSSWISPRFLILVGCGSLLALTTISDGFVYLMLQQKSSASAGFLPLFYVLTAATYMSTAVPAGYLADRHGRRTIFVAGYALLGILYAVLWSLSSMSVPALIGCLALLGLYYACTEGVLMAMASAMIPAGRRTTGLAIVATTIGVGKLLSSVLFGWLWQSFDMVTALTTFAVALGAAIALVPMLVREEGRS